MAFPTIYYQTIAIKFYDDYLQSFYAESKAKQDDEVGKTEGSCF